MKTKIYDALKQTYSSKYGVGEEVLRGYADSLAATNLVTDENINVVVQGQESALRAYQSSFDKIRTEKANAQKEIDELKAKMNNVEPIRTIGSINEPTIDGVISDDQLFERISKIYDEKYKVVTDELKAFKDADILKRRNKFINTKANELGIPQYRIDEGFVFTDEDGEVEIGNKLTKIAQNIKTNSLPTSGPNQSIQINNTSFEDDAKTMLNNILKR